MDTRDGRIYSAELVEKMAEQDRQYMKPMAYHPTPEQRATGKVGRNHPCPCGSGRKFKKCCLWRQAIDREQDDSNI
jgi:preprotein translocase subunit SecA